MKMKRSAIKAMHARKREKDMKFVKNFFNTHSVKNQNCHCTRNEKNCRVCGRRIGKGERSQHGQVLPS